MNAHPGGMLPRSPKLASKTFARDLLPAAG